MDALSNAFHIGRVDLEGAYSGARFADRLLRASPGVADQVSSASAAEKVSSSDTCITPFGQNAAVTASQRIPPRSPAGGIVVVLPCKADTLPRVT